MKYPKKTPAMRCSNCNMHRNCARIDVYNKNTNFPEAIYLCQWCRSAETRARNTQRKSKEILLHLCT